MFDIEDKEVIVSVLLLGSNANRETAGRGVGNTRRIYGGIDSKNGRGRGSVSEVVLFCDSRVNIVNEARRGVIACEIIEVVEEGIS